MGKRGIMKILQLVISLCLALLAFTCSVEADILIIANNSVRESALTSQDIEMIFLGKMNKWNDDQRIRLAVLRRGNTHEAFLKTYIKKTPAKFSSFWKLAIVSGTGYPPKYFTNESDLIKYVSDKEGSIGYISSEMSYDEVKIISVE